MDLTDKQLLVLKKIYELGFIANYYQAFGKHKLAIYKSIGPDRIVVGHKGMDLDIDVQYRGLHFLSPQREKIIEEFKQAIDIYEDEIA